MRPTLLITNRSEWTSLRCVSPSFCVLSRLSDIHPCCDGPAIDAETVVFDFCDRDFVHNWLNDRTFPSVNKLVLASHPRATVIQWLSRRDNLEVLVHEDYWRHIYRWCRDEKTSAAHLKCISTIDYERFLIKIGDSIAPSLKKD